MSWFYLHHIAVISMSRTQSMGRELVETQLIELLRKDPFASNQSLAAMLGVSPATVSRTITSMRSRKVVRLVPEVRTYLNLRERFFVYLKLDLQTMSAAQQLDYNTYDEFAVYLVDDLAKLEQFRPFEKLLAIESIHLLQGHQQGDVLVVVDVNSSEVALAFATELGKLQGVRSTDSHVAFPRTPQDLKS